MILSKFKSNFLVLILLFFSLSLRASETQILTSLEEHEDILRQSLLKASIYSCKITIVSPFISVAALKADDLIDTIGDAVSRGAIVEVITDYNLDRDQAGKLRPRSAAGRDLLRKVGVHLIEAYRVHSKTIIVGDFALVVGSFNWLSAVRDSSSPYCNQETSTLLSGEGIEERIAKTKEALNNLKLVQEDDRSFFKTLEIAKNGNSKAYLALCKKYKNSLCYREIISQSLSCFMKNLNNLSFARNLKNLAEIAIGLKGLGVDILPQIFDRYDGDFIDFLAFLAFAKHMVKVDRKRVDEFLSNNVDGLVEAGENMRDELEALHKLELYKTWRYTADLSNGVSDGKVFDRLK
jgi:hypothetical protein